jgi:hypothetical protein
VLLSGGGGTGKSAVCQLVGTAAAAAGGDGGSRSSSSGGAEVLLVSHCPHRKHTGAAWPVGYNLLKFVAVSYFGFGLALLQQQVAMPSA